MLNIQTSIKGTILTVTLDLSKRFGKSASGKTTIVASTQGNVAVGDTGVTIGVNAYTKGE
jgi:hypothetical protein